jgi:signal transduction histidine kinase
MNELQTQPLQIEVRDQLGWEEPVRDEFPLAGHNRLSSVMRQSPSEGKGVNRLKRQRAQTARLVAIGLSVADFTHECRNEMVSLKMGLELLENLLPQETETLEIIGYMKNSEIRLHRLFEDIREYAGPVNLDLAQNQLSETWRRAWQSLRPARGERDAEIEEMGNGLDLVTRVDKFRLEQVFRNLFDNSLAACRDPVRIKVDCSQVKLNHLSQIRIHVRDNGPGLSIEQTQNVFEPFFTSKSNGTGLGMVISKRIVESHGGTMTAGNSGGGGAEFIIILPGNLV